MDTSTPLSPGWYFHRLIQELANRAARYDLLDSYAKGTNGVPVLASKAVTEAYRRLMSISRTNYAELSIEALRERMTPVGFRTGATGDDLGDVVARRIWRTNELDSQYPVTLSASLTMSMGYMIVGGVDPDLGVPLITTEDPRQVVCEVDPARRNKVRAALKVFHDDVYGIDRAYLYLPGYVVQAVRASSNGDTISFSADGWEFTGDPERLPYPDVPVVPFPNRVASSPFPMSEIEPHLSILDRITYTVLNQLEVMTLQAFRQRAIKGNLPENDSSGNPINYDDLFESSPGALWTLPETATIWESGEVTLDPIRGAARADVQAFAAVTRTPLFYLTPEATNGSAEGASLAREGLIFKAADRIVTQTGSLKRVMSLAFLTMGDTERANQVDMDVIWAPPERFSLAERADAASKAIAAGVPWRTVMVEIMQYTPSEVARMETERAADAFTARLAVRPTPVA